MCLVIGVAFEYGQAPDRMEPKGDFSYKDVHLELFREKKMAWPPALDAPQFNHIEWGSLGRRACEVVLLLDSIFPAPTYKEGEPPILQFVDVNPDIKRLLVQDSQGRLKSPWRAHPQTLTGRCQLVLRVVNRSGASIRPLQALELFALIGWFPTAFKEGVDVPHVGLAASLCGNSFSGFHIGPAFMSLVSIVDMAVDARPFAEVLQEQEKVAAQGVEDSDVESL